MANRKDLYDQLDEIRKELSSLQNRITNIYAIANELGIEDQPRPKCADCGASFKGPNTLAEHRYVSHDGEVPAHWIAAEARSAGDWEPPPQPPTLGRR